jgi:hypothetical protein
MGTTATSPQRLTHKQSNGRIVNKVAELLRKKLTVPQIYMRPRVPSLDGIGVVAVDHAGSGDFHGVEVRFGESSVNVDDLEQLIARLKSMPLHFKYVALPDSVASLELVQKMFSSRRVFDPQGIGRIGLISYSAALLEGDLSHLDEEPALLLTKPERFLLRGGKLETMEQFIVKTKPDISVRI